MRFSKATWGSLWVAWRSFWVHFGGGFGIEKVSFEGSEPLDSIGRANEISIFRVLDIGDENGRFWVHLGGGVGGARA